MYSARNIVKRKRLLEHAGIRVRPCAYCFDEYCKKQYLRLGNVLLLSTNRMHNIDKVPIDLLWGVVDMAKDERGMISRSHYLTM